MTAEEAETTFRQLRWSDTDGAPVCPHCGGLDAYDCRRKNGAPRLGVQGVRQGFLDHVRDAVRLAISYRCKAYLAAIAIFCNEVKGKSALAMSRDLGLSYKSAFVLLHKLREAMAAELKGRVSAARARLPKSTGGYFGGYVKPANLAEKRKRSTLRRSTSPASAKRSSSFANAAAIQSRPCSARKAKPSISSSRGSPRAPSSMRMKSPNWNELHSRFEMKRINHEEAYSLDGACTNWAEEFFSRMRRAEIGHHHHIAGAYLLRYAQEASWREDHRRVIEWRSGEPRCRIGNGEQTERRFLRLLAAACFSYGLSHSLSGRVIRRAEK